MSFDAQWELVAVDGTHFQLKNRATGMFLDGMSRTNNGDDVALWANTTSNAAQWTFTLPSSEEATLRIPDSANTNSFSKDAVVIYPNPTNARVNIYFNSTRSQDIKLKLLSAIGEIIFIENLNRFKGEYSKQINLKDYPKAIYFLEIETNNGVINKKLILQ